MRGRNEGGLEILKYNLKVDMGRRCTAQGYATRTMPPAVPPFWARLSLAVLKQAVNAEEMQF